MKKTLKTIIILSLTLVFLSASCEKPDSEPVFTQGFSCKINGVEWVAKTPASIGGAVPILIAFTENNSSLLINATKKIDDQNIYQRINILIKNIYSTGQYKMRTYDGNGDPRAGFLSFSGNTGCAGYTHDSLNPGNIKICIFDEEKREISGTFNMTLINRDCTDSLMYITDGKFAFRY